MRRCIRGVTHYHCSERVEEIRLRMFGHILRSDDNTPAYISLVFAISNPFKNSKGCHLSGKTTFESVQF